MTVSVTCDVDSIVAVLARLVARCHSSELQMTAAKWFVSLYFLLWCTWTYLLAARVKTRQVCQTPMFQSPAANLVLSRWQWYSCHWEGTSRLLERFGLLTTTWASAHYWLMSYDFWNGNEHHHVDHLEDFWLCMHSADYPLCHMYVICMVARWCNG